MQIGQLSESKITDRLATDTSSSYSHWQIVYLLMTMCFCAVQTPRAFRSAHILLHANVRNDDVVTEKKSNSFVVVTIIKCTVK